MTVGAYGMPTMGPRGSFSISPDFASTGLAGDPMMSWPETTLGIGLSASP